MEHISSKMKQVIHNTVEVEEVDMPSNFWRRNKKPSIDLLDEHPFALDRQLEDQRYLLRFNKNPQAFKTFDMDKFFTEANEIGKILRRKNLIETETEVSTDDDR